jgi:Lar family restriction alleviation protein
MSEEFAQCPFCNWTKSSVKNGDTYAYWVECSDCGAEGPVEDDEAEAIAAWNHRAQPEPAAPTVVEPEPVAWMWQHEETGHTGFVSGGFDRAHFEKHNPRLKIIAPCYRHPPRTALTVDQAIYALSSALAESKGWLRDYSDGVIRAAIDRRDDRTALTDEELERMYNAHASYQECGPLISGWFDFARAIEAAHGIKEQT